ncbi:MAG: NINE protein [Synechococcaceae cyanobacterium RM1_1_27]|nr:NINE protein [Synechococcaceae cyanobacterium SM2_3_2]NJO85501.1 NINE protein [Synechococcaceae cyanobacterium RM1_1_27]
MRNKLVAALLAFFLGGFGIHKFYLGEGGAGILYLLFFWTFIPGILGVIDCILLLLMPDPAFELKYNGVGGGHTFESTKDKAAALTELKGLYDQGIITAGEYEDKRTKILKSI